MKMTLVESDRLLPQLLWLTVATGAEKLENTGIELLEQDGQVIIDGVGFDSAAEQAGLDFDQVIQNVMVPKGSLPKELMYIPVFGLLFLLWKIQSGRREKLAVNDSQQSNEVTA